jgi:hypothetical protein
VSSQNSSRDDRSLRRELADIRRRLKTLETAPRTGNASVSHGKFLVKNGDTELLRSGYLGTASGSDIRGTDLRRPTGERAFSTWAGTGTGGFWALHDKQENLIFSDDATAGQGLATPYIGAPVFAPNDRTKWPAVTATTYTGQWTAIWFKQHPVLHVSVWTSTDAGTSGDVQVTCNGVSSSQAVPSGDNTIRDLMLTVPGVHLASFQVVINLRRTTGTGVMACWPTGVQGRQSP